MARFTLAAAVALLCATSAAAQQQSAVAAAELVVDSAPYEPLAWIDPAAAFTRGLRATFIRNEFLHADDTEPFPQSAVMAYTGDVCPEGWQQLKSADDDGVPLFFAFGLMVDADGIPITPFVRMLACVKQ